MSIQYYINYILLYIILLIQKFTTINRYPHRVNCSREIKMKSHEKEKTTPQLSFLFTFKPAVTIDSSNISQSAIKNTIDKVQTNHNESKQSKSNTISATEHSKTRIHREVIKQSISKSLPLQWSKQFGDQGRRYKQSIIQKHNAKIAKALIPPPGQANGLVELINKLIKILFDSLLSDLRLIRVFALRFRQVLLSTNKDNNKQGENIINYALTTFTLLLKHLVDSDNSTLSTLAPILIKGITSTPTDSYTYTSAREGSTLPVLALSPIPVMESAIEELSSEQLNAIVRLLLLLHHLPNQKSTKISLRMLLWILSHVEEDQNYDQFEQKAKDLFNYTHYSDNIIDNINILNAFITDRGVSGPSKYELKHKNDAENTLKYWYTDDIRVCEKSTFDNNSNNNSYNSYKKTYIKHDTSPSAAASIVSMKPRPPSGPPPSSSSSSSSQAQGQRGRKTTTAQAIYTPKSPDKSNIKVTAPSPSPSIRVDTSSPSALSTLVPSSPTQSKPRTGYRPVASTTLHSSTLGATAGTSPMKGSYRSESSSPGHIRTLMSTQSLKPATTSVLASTHSPGHTTLPSRIEAHSKTEHVLVKVQTHKGLTSILSSLNWDSSTAPPSSSEAHRETATTSICPNRVIRCKRTDNTASTSEIFNQMALMIDSSLRVFGANLLIEDILEDPPPSHTIPYQSSTLDLHTTTSASTKSKKTSKKNNIYPIEFMQGNRRPIVVSKYAKLDPPKTGNPYELPQPIESSLSPPASDNKDLSISRYLEWVINSSNKAKIPVEDESEVPTTTATSGSSVSGSGSGVDDERLLYEIAPTLTTRQWELAMVGLLSDHARALIVSIIISSILL